MLGHGGQVGVPKVAKKQPTNPFSPKLGSRRRNQSPSLAIQKVRAEEKAKKEMLRASFSSMPEYKGQSTFTKKKLPPDQNPYIPFKARPIQTAPKPLRHGQKTNNAPQKGLAQEKLELSERELISKKKLRKGNDGSKKKITSRSLSISSKTSRIPLRGIKQIDDQSSRKSQRVEIDDIENIGPNRIFDVLHDGKFTNIKPFLNSSK